MRKEKNMIPIRAEIEQGNPAKRRKCMETYVATLKNLKGNTERKEGVKA